MKCTNKGFLCTGMYASYAARCAVMGYKPEPMPTLMTYFREYMLRELLTTCLCPSAGINPNSLQHKFLWTSSSKKSTGTEKSAGGNLFTGVQNLVQSVFPARLKHVNLFPIKTFSARSFANYEACLQCRKPKGIFGKRNA